MADDLTPDEIHELIAVHALHALDGPELERLEGHLRAHPQARDELRTLQHVAALYSGACGGEAPAELWERIAASLSPAAPRARLVFPHPRPRSRLRWAVGLIAALLLVGFALKTVSDGRQLQQVRAALHQDALVRAAQAGELSPGSRHARLRSPDGRYAAEAVVLRDGTAYLERSNLPRLAADRTYQLWALVNTTKVSAGILGPRIGLSAFKVANDPWGLAITFEERAGAPSSTNQPVVVGQVLS